MLGLQVTIRDQKFESADQNFAAANQIQYRQEKYRNQRDILLDLA